MSASIVLDTNVLMRLLLRDHPIQSEAVARWLDRQSKRRGVELVVLQLVITELVRALRAAPYSSTHRDLVAVVEGILHMPFVVEGAPIVETALELYRSAAGRDWEDCMIAAYAIAHAGGALATYDRKLGQLPGLNVITP